MAAAGMELHLCAHFKTVVGSSWRAPAWIPAGAQIMTALKRIWKPCEKPCCRGHAGQLRLRAERVRGQQACAGSHRGGGGFARGALVAKGSPSWALGLRAVSAKSRKTHTSHLGQMRKNTQITTAQPLSRRTLALVGSSLLPSAILGPPITAVDNLINSHAPPATARRRHRRFPVPRGPESPVSI